MSDNLLDPNLDPILDPALMEQLKSVFGSLTEVVELVCHTTGREDTNHPDQASLMGLLSEVASTSDKIKVRSLTENKMDNQNGQGEAGLPLPPYFEIFTQGKPTGISFLGIPNGHEFSSLVLAILNANQKGKFPSDAIKKKIKSLKGPIAIKTYISLTCENCPEVVQALNLMAIIHDQFTHTMVDGAYAQDEIQALGIQGVPAVVAGSKLLHSGRSDLPELLDKLGKAFGGESVVIENPDLGHFDVGVIGAGPAGASAAIYSVRKGLKTAVVAEKIGGQVRETKGIENLISVPYTEGPELAGQLLKHMETYPIEIFEQRRVKKIEKLGESSPKTLFKIHFDSNEYLSTESVIIASGAKWRELGIEGEKEYLGRGVAFCPHCDGPFYKNKKVAVIGGGNSGVEAALDLSGIVKEVVLFEFLDTLKADQVLVEKLKKTPNASIITSAKTTRIVGDQSKVIGIEYLNRKTEALTIVDLDGVFVQIGLVPNSSFVKDLVETNKMGEIIVDQKGQTSQPGIYAAGDVTTTPFKQIIISMGEGAKTALAVFENRMHRQ